MKTVADLVGTVYQFKDEQRKIGSVEFHRIESLYYGGVKWVVSNGIDSMCLNKDLEWIFETPKLKSTSSFKNCLFDSLEEAVRAYVCFTEKTSIR